MRIPSGISKSAIKKAQQEAIKLVAKYDKNNNGLIEEDERTLSLGHGKRDVMIYVDNKMFGIGDTEYDRVTLTGDQYVTAKNSIINRTADQIAESYLNSKDTNKDGKVGWGEKNSWGYKRVADGNEELSTIETAPRKIERVVEEITDYNY
jgi:hypothetical protein